MQANQEDRRAGKSNSVYDNAKTDTEYNSESEDGEGINRYIQDSLHTYLWGVQDNGPTRAKHSNKGERISLIDIPWNYVLFPSLLSALSPTDWLAIAQTSKAYHQLIVEFFRENRRIAFHPGIGSPENFKILTRYSVLLRVAIFTDCTWLTDELIRPVVQNNTNLKRLDVSGCSALTDAFLQGVAVYLPRLSYLLVAGCTLVTGASVEYLAFQHSKRETTMALVKEDAISFSQLAPADSLQFLGHSGLRTKTQERRKSRYAGKEKLYTKLQSAIYIAKLKRRQRSMSVTAAQHPGLLHLDLTRVASFTDADVTRLAFSFKQLEILGLGGNCQLTDVSMAQIAKNLGQLVSLDISGCFRITERGIFTVAKMCKSLKAVNITNCNFSRKISAYLKSKGIRLISPVLVFSSPGMEPMTPDFRLTQIDLISPQMLQQLEQQDGKKDVV